MINIVVLMNEQCSNVCKCFRTITGGGAASLYLEVRLYMYLHTPFSTLSPNLISASLFPHCYTLATQASWFSHFGFLRVPLASLLRMPSSVRSTLLSRLTELFSDVCILLASECSQFALKFLKLRLMCKSEWNDKRGTIT